MAVCGVFTLWRAEDVPKGEEMMAGRRCSQNPEISNADVASVHHSYPVSVGSEASYLCHVKLRFNTYEDKFGF